MWGIVGVSSSYKKFSSQLWGRNLFTMKGTKSLLITSSNSFPYLSFGVSLLKN